MQNYNRYDRGSEVKDAVRLSIENEVPECSIIFYFPI